MNILYVHIISRIFINIARYRILYQSTCSNKIKRKLNISQRTFRGQFALCNADVYLFQKTRTTKGPLDTSKRKIERREREIRSKKGREKEGKGEGQRERQRFRRRKHKMKNRDTAYIKSFIQTDKCKDYYYKVNKQIIATKCRRR